MWLALAAFAERGVAFGNGVPSLAFFVWTGSVVLGAAAPLCVYVPGVLLVEFASPPVGLAAAPPDLSVDEPFDAVARFPVAPLALDDALPGDMVALPPVPEVADPVPWACATAAAHRIPAQAAPSNVFEVIEAPAV